MNPMDKERERNRSELGHLIRLARRFAPPDYPKARADRHDDLFELRWWWAALAGAIRAILSDNHPLFVRTRAAEDDDGLLLELWKDVARLPYEVVQEVIDFVRLQRGMWDLEAFIESPGKEEQ